MKRGWVCFCFLFVLSCTAQSDIKKAKELVSEGKFHSAIEYYLSFVEKKPNAPQAQDALLEVGHIQEKILNHIDESLSTYQTLVTYYPVNDKTIEAQFRVAQILKTKKNDYNQALTEYDKLIRAASTHPNAPKFQFEIADCYTQLHQYQQANIEYQTLIEKYASYEELDEVYYKKANNNYIGGFYDQAVEDFSTLIQEFPKTKYKQEALFGLASTHEEMGDLNQAKRLYEQIQDTHPTPEIIEIRLKGLEKRLKAKSR